MIYVTSDWHGYPVDKIKQLFDKVNFGDDDFCYVLGDVIDRGEDGVRLLQWLMDQPNVELLMGNHEAMMLSCDWLFQKITDKSVRDLNMNKMQLMLNWQKNGAEPTLNAMKRLGNDERADIMDYLANLPLYIQISVGKKEYILTHSGIANFDPDKDISDHAADDLLWCRPKLSDKYYDDKTVIFGHTPTLAYGEMYKGKPIMTETWINVDSGAAAGLPPILLRLDDMAVFRL